MPGDYAVPYEGQGFIKPQTAFNTLLWPVAGDAISFNKISITPNQEKKPRSDHRGTRSVGATILGKRSGSYTLSGLYVPSGSLGVAPDIGELIKACMGIETVTGGVSVLYSFIKDLETAMKGLSMHLFANHFAVSVLGAIVNDLTIKWSGEGEVEFEASGEAADVVRTGSSTVATAQTAGNASVVVASGDGPKYSIGSQVKVDVEGGRVVTDVVGDTLTVAPVVTAAQTVGQTVVPDEPAGTTTGDAISGVSCNLQVDAAAVEMISGQFKMSNKSTLRNNLCGSAVANGFRSPEAREVMAELELYLTKPNFKYAGDAILNNQKDLQIKLGDVPGKRCVIDMNKFEFNPFPLDSPESDEAVISLSGVAKPTANEDEATLLFN